MGEITFMQVTLPLPSGRQWVRTQLQQTPRLLHSELVQLQRSRLRAPLVWHLETGSEVRMPWGRGLPLMHAVGLPYPLWARRHSQQMPWLAHSMFSHGHMDWFRA